MAGEIIPFDAQLPADLNGTSSETANEQAILLIQQATEEAAQQDTQSVTLWRYSVGKDAIGQAILFALIGFGLYVTLHSTYDFVNTYVGELYGGFGALPVAILTDVSVLCWIYMATQHANNLVRLGIAVGMVFVAIAAVAGILFGEIVARAWLASNVVFFSFLLTISLYGSVLAATIYKITSLTTYARIRHIFNFGVAPDINTAEFHRMSTTTPQIASEAATNIHRDQGVKKLLKSGKLDDFIISERNKNTTVQAIADALQVPNKKHEIERRITQLKREKKLA